MIQFLFRATALSCGLSVLLIGCGGGSSSSSDNAQTPREEEWNIVVVVTDDQRWDTLDVMPTTLQTIAEAGVTFNNSFVTTPVCGPFRASLLAGGYLARDTEILTNDAINGGWSRLNEDNSMAARLQSAGYLTGFAGKYQNGFTSLNPQQEPIIPPGWDYFYANNRRVRPSEDWNDNGFIKFDNQVDVEPIRGRSTQYLTDFETQNAVDFIDAYGANRFFLMVSYHAPRFAAIPAPEDETGFQDFLYRGRAWGEADMSDKSPKVLERAQTNAPWYVAQRDTFARNQLRTLQAVDRGIAEIMAAVERAGASEKTAVFFVSDNGLLWLDHNLIGKASPFDEAIRVPFAAIIPGGTAEDFDGLVAANLDLPATIFDIADLSYDGPGKSLLPALKGLNTEERTELYFENYAEGGGRPYIWVAALRKEAGRLVKLSEYQDGSFEFYDLEADPFEEENAFIDPTYAGIVGTMRSSLDDFKSIAILDDSLPGGTVGAPFTRDLRLWGEVGATTIRVTNGELPPGVAIDGTSIVGTPNQAGLFEFTLEAESSQISIYNGNTLKHRSRFMMQISDQT